MNRKTSNLGTTHIDRHGEQFTLSALESVATQINHSYIPVGVEHDPRIPPQGRVIRAWIVELADGHYALEGELELFEEGDVYGDLPEDRRIAKQGYSSGSSLGLSADRGLRHEHEIEELAALLGTEAEEEIKKAFDPIAVLTVAGAFVMGGIAGGFLPRLGEDAYDALKSKLKELFARRNKQPAETLLRLALVVTADHGEIEIEVILSRPDDRSIEALLGNALTALDTILPELINSNRHVKRIVFEVVDGELQIRFGLR
jgi:hypothetical protein